MSLLKGVGVVSGIALALAIFGFATFGYLHSQTSLADDQQFS